MLHSKETAWNGHELKAAQKGYDAEIELLGSLF